MRSRTFLNVSLSVLALAAAYHLGARNAGAHSGDGPSVYWEGGPMLVTPQGAVYRWTLGSGNPSWQLRGNVFGGASGGRVIVDAGERVALASTGEVFFDTGTGGYGPWESIGSPAGGPTPAQSESWGSVKAKYRGERAAVTTDR